jgi:hypothetical protein
VNDQDRKRAAELTSMASGFADKVCLNLDHLESFVRANHFSPDTPLQEVWALFAGQWLNSGRAASSLNVMMDDFKKFRVSPFDIGAARERLEQFRVRNAIARLASQRGRTRNRAIHVDPLPGVPATAPSVAKERERLAFWALVCVTGNRAANVLVARRVVPEEHGVRVEWGVRKVRGSSTVTYLYEWSGRPPAWVLQRWTALERIRWPFPNGHTMAAALNSWLVKWKIPLTSSSPRERLNHRLRKLVRDGVLVREDYVRLIDHEYATGVDHYSTGVIVGQKVKPSE